MTVVGILEAASLHHSLHGRVRMRYPSLSFPIVLLSVASYLFAQHLSPSQPKALRERKLLFAGVVAGEHTATSSKRQPTFINLDAPYPRQVFTVLIFRKVPERLMEK